MSRGSAWVSILFAFFVGLVVGKAVDGPGGSGESADIAAADDTAGVAAPAEVGGPERFNVPVTAAQPSKGATEALVTIVEFSDFQCPFCTRVEPTISQLLNDYKGKLRVVWRNNPLPFHQAAGPAAELSMEAFKQGGAEKFWAAHKILFDNQRALERPQLEQYAQQLGLDLNKVKAALDGHTHQAGITEDQALATRLGARGTPAFFINGRFLSGAQPIENFKTIIDDEIARADKLVKAGVRLARVYAELTKGGLTAPAAAAPGAAGAAPAQPRRMPDPNAVYKVPVGDSAQKGPSDALVTIVEFSEFQCPFCSRVLPTAKQIVDTYGRDVRIVFKHNPLPFHKDAGPASQLALEAHRQGKFWEAHDLLFGNQQALARENLETYAQQLGLNMAKVRAALDGETYKAAIEADQALARSLGASGTPSFFINGRNLRGAQPFEAFKAVIDEELAKARALVASGTPRARVYEVTTQNGATEAKFIEAPAAPGGQPAAAPAEPDANKIYNIAVPRNAPRKGGANAKVVIQEFSDFQCPFCSRVNPTVKQIFEKYGDKVAIIWRNFPLPFHQEAGPAAEAAMEAFAQGGSAKFWAMHDLLFENQRALSRADLDKYAAQIGLNAARFKAAMDNHTHKASIDADMAAVTAAGAQIGTPSFFINGKLLQGAQPFPAFEAAIDAAIAAAH